MLLLGLVALSSLAAISTLTATANNLAGLQGVAIRPFGDFAIDPGESLLLTAEGDYVSYTVPMRSTWSIVDGNDLGYFLENDCSNETTCTYKADMQGGDVTIAIHASGFTSQATIHIRTPTTPKPVVNPFLDSLPDWAAQAIVDLRNRAIISGYENGNFGAGDTLTRGQLITIIYRTLLNAHLVSPPKNCSVVYNDIPVGHYAYEAACVFRAQNWTDALSTLEPNDPVNRGETASFISRIFGADLLTAKELRLGTVLAGGPYFSDVPIGNPYYADSAIAKAIDVLRGNPDGTFSPKQILNRAEAATSIWRVLQEIQ